MAVPVSGDAKEMDKYEFNIKVEQIKKMVSRGDYGTAMKIADTIDWHRVRNASLLSMIAQIYEKNVPGGEGYSAPGFRARTGR